MGEKLQVSKRIFNVRKKTEFLLVRPEMVKEMP
jgi:hypothetical protein